MSVSFGVASGTAAAGVIGIPNRPAYIVSPQHTVTTQMWGQAVDDSAAVAEEADSLEIFTNLYTYYVSFQSDFVGYCESLDGPSFDSN